uniref:Uncharacterized protein n=1 Tax=Arundo donax TaxID=35708 RepID=A0A0A9GJW5_ARUDO
MRRRRGSGGPEGRAG